MDTAMDWKCTCCGAEGFGYPEQCPDCLEYNAVTPTEASYRTALTAHRALRRRAEAVLDLLDFGYDSIDFCPSYNSDGDTFETTWKSENCRCGCSGYTTHVKEVPIRYLWTPDAEIQAELEATKQQELAMKAPAMTLADEFDGVKKVVQAGDMTRITNASFKMPVVQD